MAPKITHFAYVAGLSLAPLAASAEMWNPWAERDREYNETGSNLAKYDFWRDREAAEKGWDLDKMKRRAGEPAQPAEFSGREAFVAQEPAPPPPPAPVVDEAPPAPVAEAPAPIPQRQFVAAPAPVPVPVTQQRYTAADAGILMVDATRSNQPDKWQNSVKSVFWEDYRGNNVRIELLRTNSDMKEMRLKFVQSQDLNADPDGAVQDMLDTVAARVMKRTCGRRARQAITLYERPSVEYTRQTAADPYQIVSNGSSLREYGFRCVY